MRILIIKMSSLGDVVHTFPAVTELAAHIPGIEIDWLVEEAYASLVQLHPAIKRVIPVALRRWRRSCWMTWRSGEWQRCKKGLRESYDLIIDAQGLYKSAWMALQAKGVSGGYAYQSAREPLSTLLLKRHAAIPKSMHAVHRTRLLFASLLGYSINLAEFPLAFPLAEQPMSVDEFREVLFLPGTSWSTKRWPLAHWQHLAKQLVSEGVSVKIAWGDEEEHAFALAIQTQVPLVQVLDRQPLVVMQEIIMQVDCVVAVDSGLAHLASLLGKRVVSLYGPTDPNLTGTLGPHATTIQIPPPCAPCKQEHCRLHPAIASEAMCMQNISPTHVRHVLKTVETCR